MYVDEDEAEYAWLSADNIRLFCHGDTSGKKDGSHIEDEQLQRCIVAAQNALAVSESQTQNWKDDEDSDGGLTLFITQTVYSSACISCRSRLVLRC